MKDKVFHVTIINWGKHNPRSDRGGFSWSKLDNQFHLHMRERRGYSAVATNLMVVLFQECSRADGKGFKLRVPFAAKALGYSTKAIVDGLRELATGHDDAGGEITLNESSSALKAVEDSSSLDGLTDKTDGLDKTDTANAADATSKLKLDFDSLYQKYPKREGKQKGLATCKAQIRTPEDFEALSLAIDRYTAHCRREATDSKYIKHFSTFMNCWRDWLEPDAGTVVRPVTAEPEWRRKALEQERMKNGA